MSRESFRSFFPCLLVSACAAMAAVAAAQTPAFRGDDLIICDDLGSQSKLFVVQANGTTTEIPVSVRLKSLSGVCATRRGELVISDWRANSLVLVPPVGNATVLATVARGLRVTEDIDGSFLVTSLQNFSVERVTRSGQTSTVFRLSGGSRPVDVLVDENGDYIYCDDRGTGTTPKGVFHVDRTTNVLTTLYTGPALQSPYSLAFFQNGDVAVVDGANGDIHRLDRATGQLSMFLDSAALGNTPQSIVESGDGGFIVAFDHAVLGRELVRVDSTGKITSHGGKLNLNNLEQVAVVHSLHGPTDLATGPNTMYDFNLDVPAHPGAPYWIGLSASMFPGAGLPNDPRGLSVNPDDLFLSVLFGTAPTVFVRFAGTTDATGMASPQLNLSAFPPGALAGFTGFAQGFVLDATATNGVGAITNPLRVDFR